MKHWIIAAALMVTGGVAAQAQEKYLGEIMLVGYGFCPRDTADANGQLLPIADNTALFSLYGATFGGDGRTNFALPDLRGRVPVHTGQAPGLSNYQLGAAGGTETRTLTVAQMPAHAHGVTAQLNASNAPGSAPTPAGNLPALSTVGSIYGTVPQGGATEAMASNAITLTEGNAGGGQAVDIRQPFLAMRYCVVLQGIYPSRN